MVVTLLATLAICGCSEKQVSDETNQPQTSSGILTEEAVLNRIGDDNEVTVSSGGDVSVEHEVLGDGFKPILDLSDINDIFKKLFEDPRVTIVKVTVPLHGIDDYGQKKTEIAMQMTMTKATAERINWENFNFVDLPKIADKVYINPAVESME
jgi:hypothetical protein